MTYSAIHEKVLVDFTRDYDLIKQTLNKNKIEHSDKTSIHKILETVNRVFASNWGIQNYCQVIVITDCGLGLGPLSVKNTINNIKNARTGVSTDSTTLLPFSFPSKMSIMCLGNIVNDPSFKYGTNMYQQLLDISGQKGQLFIPKTTESGHETRKKSTDNGNESSASTNDTFNLKTHLTERCVRKLFKQMNEINFKPFEATLNCGSYFKLESPISLWPQPLPFTSKDVFGMETTKTISRKLEVCGYINISDIGSPASLSRNLILPRIDKSDYHHHHHHHHHHKPKDAKNLTEIEKLEIEMKSFFAKTNLSDEKSEDSNEASSSQQSNQSVQNEANVCVLLHGALKVENIAALILLSDNWFGFAYSYADKKKSNLMLQILPPGADVVPWLGDLRYLGTIDDASPGETPSFPVKPEKRSYSQNIVVWIRQSGLSSDIQKVLRHAKKLPDKTQHFYKELNRIRRNALSLGFFELLEGLAVIFEMEVANLPANNDTALQLRHSAQLLRTNRDLKNLITPIATEFNQPAQ